MPKDRRNIYAGRFSDYLARLEIYFRLYIPGNDASITRLFDYVFAHLASGRRYAPIILVIPWSTRAFPFQWIFQAGIAELFKVFIHMELPKPLTDRDIQESQTDWYDFADQLQEFVRPGENFAFDSNGVRHVCSESETPWPILYMRDTANLTAPLLRKLRGDCFGDDRFWPRAKEGSAIFVFEANLSALCASSFTDFRVLNVETAKALKALFPRLPSWFFDLSFCVPFSEPSFQDLLASASILFGERRYQIKRTSRSPNSVRFGPEETADICRTICRTLLTGCASLEDFYARILDYSRGLDLVELKPKVLAAIETEPPERMVYACGRAPESAARPALVSIADFENRTFAFEQSALKPAAQNRPPAWQTYPAVWNTLYIPDEIKADILRRVKRFVDGLTSGRDGLLLYGPPGTGKTLIAKAIAQTVDCAFFPLTVPHLKGAHLGHTAEKVSRLWDQIRAAGTAVVFIDECDAVFARRGGVNTDSFVEELINTFVSKWEGLESLV